MSDKNVTTEVLNQIIDSMPEPSSAAEEILKSESVSESVSESAPEPEPKTGGGGATIPPLEWKSVDDENQPQSVEAKRVDAEATNKTPLLDSAGVGFDPNYHSTDSNGNPSKTKSGKWRRKRGVTGSPAPTVDATAMLAAALAVTITIEQLGSCIGGDEWKPEQNEHEMMVNAWRDYFMVAGAVGIPPYLGVILATGAYAMPRLSQPKTASTLERIWGWCKRGVSWIF